MPDRSVAFLLFLLAGATAPVRAGEWQLVWCDEFEKAGLPDPSRWDQETGFIRNGELQLYTGGRKENARVEDGMLVIEARKERLKNPAFDPASQPDKARRNRELADYTSASLVTRGKASWTYGRIEVRAKLPSGRGTWPAIWTLGADIGEVRWPACGEIDIMEFVGFEPGVVHANVHTRKYNHLARNGKGDRTSVADASETFHLYAIEWDRERIDFFVDDRKYFSYPREGPGTDGWPFDKPQYLLLNLAIGGAWGGQEGVDDDIFPQRFLVDHVRVYQMLPAAGAASPGAGAPPAAADPFAGLRAGGHRRVAGMEICWCPAGRFTMGSPPGEPERRPGEDPVEVTLTRGFWIGKYEVTQAQWKRVAGDFPAKLTAGEGDDFPVYSINFAEAEGFCEKLTREARASGELPGGWEFRLPTEAQWEYACRAGTRAATAFGDSLTRKQANFEGKPYGGADEGPSLKRAAPVGGYAANPWGIHDMHGNVFEWCRDWYHARLPGGVDPDLLSAKPSAERNRDGTFSRVRRGGCWADPGWPCRSAFRLRFEPERRADHIGFRVVLVRA
jgi:sulfatase modifying factor 1